MDGPKVLNPETVTPVTSSYVFEGDELISAEAYEATMRNWYACNVPVVNEVFKGSGVDLDPAGYERVKRMLTGSHWLDHFLDEADDRQEAYTLYSQTVTALKTEQAPPSFPEWAPPELETSLHLLQNSMEDIDVSVYMELLDMAQSIADISMAKAECTSLKRYITLLKEEGRLTLRIGALVATNGDETLQRGLSSWIDVAGEGMTLLDSALDLPKDYENGLTNVQPTRINQLQLAARGLVRLPRTLKGVGIKALLNGYKALKEPVLQ